MRKCSDYTLTHHSLHMTCIEHMTNCPDGLRSPVIDIYDWTKACGEMAVNRMAQHQVISQRQNKNNNKRPEWFVCESKGERDTEFSWRAMTTCIPADPSRYSPSRSPQHMFYRRFIMKKSNCFFKTQIVNSNWSLAHSGIVLIIMVENQRHNVL